MELTSRLLEVSPDAVGDLTTIYVKFTATGEPLSPVYAVVWVKHSDQWIVGLALPDDLIEPPLGPPLPGYKYAGLTKYFTIAPSDPIPERLADWARIAYKKV